MEKTKLGIPQNFEAALAYSVLPISPVTGFILLVLETENKLVRFHAMQSFILFAFYWVAAFLLSALPFIGDFLAGIVGCAAFISWLILIINAVKGNFFKFPFIGEAIYEKTVT